MATSMALQLRAPAAAGRVSASLRRGGVPSLPVASRRCVAPRRCARARGPVRAAASLGPLPGAGSAGASLLAQLADAAEAVVSPEDAAAAAAAAQLAANKSGFLGGIANVLESTLEGIDGVLAAVHVPYSYGFSIIALTLLVKVVTFPLSKKQIESTTAMQALQPRVKDLQARYANNQEQLQRETAKLYQEAGVNPLAGCLPTLATLPVFIGLYRALTNAASDGLLTEGFFWIPSLGGPSSMGDNASGRGLGWLFPLIDGAPPIGWHDAACYLVLPILLVASQFVSQKIMQPNQSQDPSQASANAILKFLPFMVGWFSLNVPSGLTLYWIVNNVLTTAQTVYLRGAVAAAANAPAAMPAASTAKSLPPNPPPMTADKRVATPVNAEIVGGDSSSSDDDSSRPGARFAALKAAEAKKGKGKRQAQGNVPKSVNWVEGSGDNKE